LKSEVLLRNEQEVYSIKSKLDDKELYPIEKRQSNDELAKDSS
jgi:hypothetical protein